MDAKTFMDEATRRAQVNAPKPKYPPLEAACVAAFASAFVALLALYIAGVERPQFAAGWTAAIVGGVVGLWLWRAQRRHEREWLKQYELMKTEMAQDAATPPPPAAG